MTQIYILTQGSFIRRRPSVIQVILLLWVCVTAALCVLVYRFMMMQRSALSFFFYHMRVNVRFYVDHSHASVSFDYNNINFVGNNSTDKNADKPNIMLGIQCIWKVYTARHLFPFLSCYFFVLKWIQFIFHHNTPKMAKLKKVV